MGCAGAFGAQLPWRLLQAAGFLEAVVATVADDDVIEHRDTQHVAGRGEAASKVEIIRRWGRIAGGMIVQLWRRRSLAERP